MGEGDVDFGVEWGVVLEMEVGFLEGYGSGVEVVLWCCGGHGELLYGFDVFPHNGT